MGFATGRMLVQHAGSGLNAYEEYTVTNLYVERLFGGKAFSVTVANDSATDTLSLSWDGVTLIGEVKAGETIELAAFSRSSIYVRGAAGGDTARIFAT